MTKTTDSLKKIIFFGALFSFVYLFIRLIGPFFDIIAVSAIICSLFYPMYMWFLGKVKKRSLAGFISVIIVTIAFVVPITLLIILLVDNIASILTNYPEIAKSITHGVEDFMNSQTFFSDWVTTLDWQPNFEHFIRTVGNTSVSIVSRTSTGLFQTLFVLIIMIYTMYYFFVDGSRFIEVIKDLSPLENSTEDKIIDSIRVTIKGTLLTTFTMGFLQASIGSIALHLVGMPYILLWSILIFVLSILPGIGVNFVFLPMAIYYFVVGNVFAGASLTVLALGVMNITDSYLRPMLLGRSMEIHPLLIFFSIIGGLVVFGPLGFIYGPVIVAIMVAIIAIYQEDYAETIARVNN